MFRNLSYLTFIALKYSRKNTTFAHEFKKGSMPDTVISEFIFYIRIIKLFLY